MSTEVVYVGGPRHGQREAHPFDPFDAPPFLTFPTVRWLSDERAELGEARYAFLPEADTPGALTYVYLTATGEQA